MLVLPTADGFAGYLSVRSSGGASTGGLHYDGGGGEPSQLLALHVTAARAGAPARLEACPQLRQLLDGNGEAVEQRLRRNSDDAAGFLADLGELVDRLASAGPSPALPSAEFYELIIRELDAVGWASLQSVSPALDQLQLLVLDAAGRGHTLGLTLPADYPSSPPQAQVALPAPFALRWPAQAVGGGGSGGGGGGGGRAGAHSLANAIEQFRAALRRHQQLWDLLDDLDEHTWVLEPKKPTREGVTRRIAIGSHCSLELELHEAAPASLPSLQFLGAEKVVAPLRHSLNARLARWQPGRSVRLNLEDVLQISFPPPQSEGAPAAESYAVECAICYSYHLDGAAPESACDGCSKPFHKACLSEWLRGLATTQQSFNRLFGECPYCCHPIACEAAPG